MSNVTKLRQADKPTQVGEFKVVRWWTVTDARGDVVGGTNRRDLLPHVIAELNKTAA